MVGREGPHRFPHLEAVEVEVGHRHSGGTITRETAVAQHLADSPLPKLRNPRGLSIQDRVRPGQLFLGSLNAASRARAHGGDHRQSIRRLGPERGRGGL